MPGHVNMEMSDDFQDAREVNTKGGQDDLLPVLSGR